MKRNIAIFFLLFFLSPLTAAAQGPRFEKAVLDNGLMAVACEQKGDISSACLFVKVKKSDEPAGQKGLTEFLNQTLLSCDPLGRGVSPVLRIEQMGGFVSVETTKEFTCFRLSVPSINFPQALGALEEILANPDLSESSISRERDGFLASKLEHLDNMDGNAFHGLFHKHHASLACIGKFESKSLGSWYYRNYWPYNMVLSICSGTSTKTSLKEARDAFGDYVPPELPASGEAEGPGAADSVRARRAGYGEEGAVALRYVAPAVGSPDYPAMLIAKAFLASGTGSEMSRCLRDGGIASVFGCRMPRLTNDPRLLIYIVPEKGKAEAAARKVIDAIDAVREGRVNGQDFERAKLCAAGELAIRESSQEKAWSAGYCEMAGLGPDYEERLAQLVEKTGSRDVARVAGKYLDKSSVEKLPEEGAGNDQGLEAAR